MGSGISNIQLTPRDKKVNPYPGDLITTHACKSGKSNAEDQRFTCVEQMGDNNLYSHEYSKDQIPVENHVDRLETTNESLWNGHIMTDSESCNVKELRGLTRKRHSLPIDIAKTVVDINNSKSNDDCINESEKVPVQDKLTSNSSKVVEQSSEQSIKESSSNRKSDVKLTKTCSKKAIQGPKSGYKSIFPWRLRSKRIFTEQQNGNNNLSGSNRRVSSYGEYQTNLNETDIEFQSKPLTNLPDLRSFSASDTFQTLVENYPNDGINSCDNNHQSKSTKAACSYEYINNFVTDNGTLSNEIKSKTSRHITHFKSFTTNKLVESEDMYGNYHPETGHLEETKHKKENKTIIKTASHRNTVVNQQCKTGQIANKTTDLEFVKDNESINILDGEYCNSNNNEGCENNDIETTSVQLLRTISQGIPMVAPSKEIQLGNDNCKNNRMLQKADIEFSDRNIDQDGTSVLERVRTEKLNGKIVTAKEVECSVQKELKDSLTCINPKKYTDSSDCETIGNPLLGDLSIVDIDPHCNGNYSTMLDSTSRSQLSPVMTSKLCCDPSPCIYDPIRNCNFAQLENSFDSTLNRTGTSVCDASTRPESTYTSESKLTLQFSDNCVRSKKLPLNTTTNEMNYENGNGQGTNNKDMEEDINCDFMLDSSDSTLNKSILSNNEAHMKGHDSLFSEEIEFENDESVPSILHKDCRMDRESSLVFQNKPPANYSFRRIVVLSNRNKLAQKQSKYDTMDSNKMSHVLVNSSKISQDKNESEEKESLLTQCSNQSDLISNLRQDQKAPSVEELNFGHMRFPDNPNKHLTLENDTSSCVLTKQGQLSSQNSLCSTNNVTQRNDKPEYSANKKKINDTFTSHKQDEPDKCNRNFSLGTARSNENRNKLLSSCNIKLIKSHKNPSTDMTGRMNKLNGDSLSENKDNSCKHNKIGKRDRKNNGRMMDMDNDLMKLRKDGHSIDLSENVSATIAVITKTDEIQDNNDSDMETNFTSNSEIAAINNNKAGITCFSEMTCRPHEILHEESNETEQLNDLDKNKNDDFVFVESKKEQQKLSGKSLTSSSSITYNNKRPQEFASETTLLSYIKNGSELKVDNTSVSNVGSPIASKHGTNLLDLFSAGKNKNASSDDNDEDHDDYCNDLNKACVSGRCDIQKGREVLLNKQKQLYTEGKGNVDIVQICITTNSKRNIVTASEDSTCVYSSSFCEDKNKNNSVKYYCQNKNEVETEDCSSKCLCKNNIPSPNKRHDTSSTIITAKREKLGIKSSSNQTVSSFTVNVNGETSTDTEQKSENVEDLREFKTKRVTSIKELVSGNHSKNNGYRNKVEICKNVKDSNLDKEFRQNKKDKVTRGTKNTEKNHHKREYCNKFNGKKVSSSLSKKATTTKANCKDTTNGTKIEKLAESDGVVTFTGQDTSDADCNGVTRENCCNNPIDNYRGHVATTETEHYSQHLTEDLGDNICTTEATSKYGHNSDIYKLDNILSENLHNTINVDNNSSQPLVERHHLCGDPNWNYQYSDTNEPNVITVKSGFEKDNEISNILKSEYHSDSDSWNSSQSGDVCNGLLHQGKLTYDQCSLDIESDLDLNNASTNINCGLDVLDRSKDLENNSDKCNRNILVHQHLNKEERRTLKRGTFLSEDKSSKDKSHNICTQNKRVEKCIDAESRENIDEETLHTIIWQDTPQVNLNNSSTDADSTLKLQQISSANESTNIVEGPRHLHPKKKSFSDTREEKPVNSNSSSTGTCTDNLHGKSRSLNQINKSDSNKVNDKISSSSKHHSKDQRPSKSILYHVHKKLGKSNKCDISAGFKDTNHSQLSTQDRSKELKSDRNKLLNVFKRTKSRDSVENTPSKRCTTEENDRSNRCQLIPSLNADNCNEHFGLNDEGEANFVKSAIRTNLINEKVTSESSDLPDGSHLEETNNTIGAGDSFVDSSYVRYDTDQTSLHITTPVQVTKVHCDHTKQKSSIPDNIVNTVNSEKCNYVVTTVNNLHPGLNNIKNTDTYTNKKALGVNEVSLNTNENCLNVSVNPVESDISEKDDGLPSVCVCNESYEPNCTSSSLNNTVRAESFNHKTTLTSLGKSNNRNCNRSVCSLDIDSLHKCTFDNTERNVVSADEHVSHLSNYEDDELHVKYLDNQDSSNAHWVETNKANCEQSHKCSYLDGVVSDNSNPSIHCDRVGNTQTQDIANSEKILECRNLKSNVSNFSDRKYSCEKATDKSYNSHCEDVGKVKTDERCVCGDNFVTKELYSSKCVVDKTEGKFSDETNNNCNCHNSDDVINILESSSTQQFTVKPISRSHKKQELQAQQLNHSHTDISTNYVVKTVDSQESSVISSDTKEGCNNGNNVIPLETCLKRQKQTSSANINVETEPQLLANSKYTGTSDFVNKYRTKRDSLKVKSVCNSQNFSEDWDQNHSSGVDNSISCSYYNSDTSGRRDIYDNNVILSTQYSSKNRSCTIDSYHSSESSTYSNKSRKTNIASPSKLQQNKPTNLSNHADDINNISEYSVSDSYIYKTSSNIAWNNYTKECTNEPLNRADNTRSSDLDCSPNYWHTAISTDSLSVSHGSVNFDLSSDLNTTCDLSTVTEESCSSLELLPSDKGVTNLQFAHSKQKLRPFTCTNKSNQSFDCNSEVSTGNVLNYPHSKQNCENHNNSDSNRQLRNHNLKDVLLADKDISQVKFLHESNTDLRHKKPRFAKTEGSILRNHTYNDAKRNKEQVVLSNKPNNPSQSDNKTTLTANFDFNSQLQLPSSGYSVNSITDCDSLYSFKDSNRYLADDNNLSEEDDDEATVYVSSLNPNDYQNKRSNTTKLVVKPIDDNHQQNLQVKASRLVVKPLENSENYFDGQTDQYTSGYIAQGSYEQGKKCDTVSSSWNFENEYLHEDDIRVRPLDNDELCHINCESGISDSYSIGNNSNCNYYINDDNNNFDLQDRNEGIDCHSQIITVKPVAQYTDVLLDNQDNSEENKENINSEVLKQVSDSPQTLDYKQQLRKQSHSYVRQSASHKQYLEFKNKSAVSKNAPWHSVRKNDNLHYSGTQNGALNENSNIITARESNDFKQDELQGKPIKSHSLPRHVRANSTTDKNSAHVYSNSLDYAGCRNKTNNFVHSGRAHSVCVDNIEHLYLPNEVVSANINSSRHKSKENVPRANSWHINSQNNRTHSNFDGINQLHNNESLVSSDVIVDPWIKSAESTKQNMDKDMENNLYHSFSHEKPNFTKIPLYDDWEQESRNKQWTGGYMNNPGKNHGYVSQMIINETGNPKTPNKHGTDSNVMQYGVQTNGKQYDCNMTKYNNSQVRYNEHKNVYNTSLYVQPESVLNYQSNKKQQDVNNDLEYRSLDYRYKTPSSSLNSASHGSRERPSVNGLQTNARPDIVVNGQSYNITHIEATASAKQTEINQYYSKQNLCISGDVMVVESSISEVAESTTWDVNRLKHSGYKKQYFNDCGEEVGYLQNTKHCESISPSDIKKSQDHVKYSIRNKNRVKGDGKERSNNHKKVYKSNSDSSTSSSKFSLRFRKKSPKANQIGINGEPVDKRSDSSHLSVNSSQESPQRSSSHRLSVAWSGNHDSSDIVRSNSVNELMMHKVKKLEREDSSQSLSSQEKAKDKSSISKIKKLKRRISASFGRLSLSKEDNSSGKRKEGSDSDVTNGHHSNFSSMDSANSPPVYDSGLCHKPPPHPYKYAGSYENPLVHPSHHAVKQMHMTSSMDESLLLSHNNHGSSSNYYNYSNQGHVHASNHGYYNSHANLPPTMSQSYHAGQPHADCCCCQGSNVHSNSSGGLHGRVCDSPVRQCNHQQQASNSANNSQYNSPSKPGIPGQYHQHLSNAGSHHSKESGYHSNRPSYHESQGDHHSNEAYNNGNQYLYDQYGHPQHPAIEQLKKTPVKRHHSTGDMLEDQKVFNNQDVRLRSVRHRPRRPKSEGNFIIEGFVPKRASSFGFNSPFGKAECYQKLEQLGEGSYATVFKGLSLLTNKVVALKEIRLQQEEGAPFTAIREASLLKGLKHANIVTLHDIIHTKDTLTFVFEFVHTDLSQYLEKHPGGLNPRNVKLFLFQLLRGLCFCHQRRILHRDLKPQNLLISEIGELKLADFGLARAKSIPSHTYSHEVVTLWYRPPDVLLGSTNYTTSLDLWGVGCIFTEMIAGSATFPGMKDAFDQLDRIWRIVGTPTEEEWEGVTSYPHYDLDKFGTYSRQRLSTVIPKLAHIPYAEHLADGLLQLQPDKRISAAAAMKHRYFADLPSKVYDVEEGTSVFNIPSMKLAPEMDQLLRTHIRTNPHTALKNKV